MTQATGSEDDNVPKSNGENAGTALAPAASGAAGIDPFLASASETPHADEPRPFYAKALDYSAHAAMIVGLVGFAWTVSEHVVSRPAAPASPAPVKLAAATAPAPLPSAAPAKVDEIGDLRRANQKMAVDIRNLHASLEALRTTVVRERGAPDAARSVSANLDDLKSQLATARGELASTKSELASAKTEARSEIAQLAGKVDRLQRDEQHPQPVVERASRAERQPVDTTTTASIPAPVKVVPTPPAKPTILASAEPDTKPQAQQQPQPQVIQGWVVRDVYEGVALIEGRRGQMEVVPGVSIPGAGVVKSIDRHGSGWTVTTSKGQLAYAAASQHDNHRAYMRDYYGPRRYDF